MSQQLRSRVSLCGRLLVALAAAVTVGASAGLSGATVTYRSYVIKGGTFVATVTPPALASNGAAPFKASFAVHGNAVSQLQIGPIHAACLANLGGAKKIVTLAKLSGFPTVTGATGFFDAAFTYRGGRWKSEPANAPQTTDSKVTFEYVYTQGTHPAYAPNSAGSPAVTITARIAISGTTARLTQAGPFTCTINASPTFELR